MSKILKELEVAEKEYEVNKAIRDRTEGKAAKKLFDGDYPESWTVKIEFDKREFIKQAIADCHKPIADARAKRNHYGRLFLVAFAELLHELDISGDMAYRLLEKTEAGLIKGAV